MSSLLYLASYLDLPTRKIRHIFAALMLLVGVGLISTPADAQFDTGSVVGTVADPYGAVVAGADVALRNTDLGTTLTRKSNSHGEYEFPDVQIGTYTVTVNAPGFAESVTKPFQLVVSSRQQINVPLKLGIANETVTVNVDDASLQKESGERSTTIENEQIVDLPLNGREYSDLALLTPGVQVSSLQTGNVDQRRGSLVVNGNRSSINNFLLDGLDNNSYQDANQGFNNQAVTESVDAVQQYTIITSNYPAEYGRAGGAVISVKTKSGTDTPHGSLYEFLRNTMFDAYGPFYGNGQKPALIQNQFGGSFGYRIPHVKDFFFFINYEGYRSVTRNLTQATIPDMNQRQGIFFAPTSTTDPTLIPVPVKNPLTGKQYPTGVIPSTDFTSFATAVLAALPAPNNPSCLTGGGCPGLTDNYASTEAGHNYRDVGDIRIDKYFGNRLQTFARFSKQSIHILDPPGIPGPAGGEGFGHIRNLVSSGAAGATYVVSPNSIVDLRLGIVFTNSGKKPFNEGVPNFFAPFNIPYPVPSNLAQSGLNTEPIYDFTTLGVEDSQNQYSSPQTYNIKGAYTLARGRHSFSFGYEWFHVNMILDPGGPLLGENQFDGLYSYLKEPIPPAPCNPGTTICVPDESNSTKQAFGVTDFIFGAQDDYSLGNYTSPTVYYDYDFAYAEDSWKVSPRLTLTYGLRYEFSTPQRAHGQRLSNFDPATNGLILATPGSIYNESLVHPKLNDFAPRFGFAYSMHPNIVFRGGYGLSYIQFNRNGNNIAINGPSVVDGSITGQSITLPLCANGSQALLTCFRTTMQGFPNSLDSPSQYSTLTSEVNYIPSHSAPGYIQSYSLGTQVQIDPATVLNLGYAGSHGVHVQVQADYNEASIQAPGQSLTLQQRRPIPTFEDIDDLAPLGFLRYNSLQAQVTHRAANGLYFMNSFTWSKAIDNGSFSGEDANGDSDSISLRNINYDNGRSGYDQRLNDSLGAVWKIPFGTQLRNRTLRQTVSGWTITTITRMNSGLPMNIYYKPDDNDLTSSTLGAYRPNYTGFLSTIVNPRSKWTRGNTSSSTCTSICNVLNSSQLSVQSLEAANNTTGQNDSPYGNMPRNALTGPNYFGMDLGLQKNFSLPDRMNLQFRCEAFDVMNHPNYKTPNTEFNNINFGVLTSAYPSRQIQFALRLTF
jgi:hypothetical protein